MAHDPLSYRIQAKTLPDGTCRHLITRSRDHHPSKIAAFYESHLSHAARSPNSKSSALNGILPLLSYADTVGLDIETRLLEGEPLLPAEMRGFAHWLEMRAHDGAPGHMPATKRKTFNNTLYHVQSFETWAVEMFFQGSRPGLRASEVSGIRDTQRRLWSSLHLPIKQTAEATDLSDDDIREIETYLKHTGVSEHATPYGARVYLTWRLAIEFGLRIGEILALRLEDCPTRSRPTFRIVRVEERNGEIDPRVTRPPRPKTLGRELSPLFANSVFPHLINDYVSTHRYGWKTSRKGQRIPDWILPHPYLLVDRFGKPLAQHSAHDDARLITEETGVHFTWHKARHAFFNRAYAALSHIENPNEQNVRMMDLVYWGGWTDPSSLMIYSQRARRERAQTMFAVWQREGQVWNALN